MSPIIHIPGRKPENRKQAREDALCLLVLGMLIILFAWLFLPAYANTATDALIASIFVSLFGFMLMVYSGYLLIRAKDYPKNDEGNKKKE